MAKIKKLQSSPAKIKKLQSSPKRSTTSYAKIKKVRKRNYKREYAQYHSKPEQIANRAGRNKARRILGLKKGDPREVDHKRPLANGGSKTARSNLRIVSRTTNRKKWAN